MQMKCCVSPSASEQHARCDHLDVKRREAGGFRPSPSKPDPVLQLQRTVTWQTLWTDPDHLHAGTKLVSIQQHFHLFLIIYFIVQFQTEFPLIIFVLSVPHGQKQRCEDPCSAAGQHVAQPFCP